MLPKWSWHLGLELGRAFLRWRPRLLPSKAMFLGTPSSLWPDRISCHRLTKDKGQRISNKGEGQRTKDKEPRTKNKGQVTMDKCFLTLPYKGQRRKDKGQVFSNFAWQRTSVFKLDPERVVYTKPSNWALPKAKVAIFFRPLTEYRETNFMTLSIFTTC